MSDVELNADSGFAACECELQPRKSIRDDRITNHGSKFGSVLRASNFVSCENLQHVRASQLDSFHFSQI